jgi:hypothetical protein
LPGLVPEEDPGGEILFVNPAQPLAKVISSMAPNPRAMRLGQLAARARSIAQNRTAILTRRVISSGSEVNGGLRRDRAVVEMDTDAEETLLPLGVIVDGVTAHVESFGAPLQVNEIGWLKLPSGLIARVRLTD